MLQRFCVGLAVEYTSCFISVMNLDLYVCCFDSLVKHAVCRITFLVPSKLDVSLSNLVFEAGCWVRLHRFLIIAVLSTFLNCRNMLNVFQTISTLRNGSLPPLCTYSGN